MSNDIDELADHLSGVLWGTVERLASEYGLSASEYIQAKAYHAHLKEYPFHLVVQAMRERGMVGGRK